MGKPKAVGVDPWDREVLLKTMLLTILAQTLLLAREAPIRVLHTTLTGRMEG
jgi:hypothetical protein